MSNRLTIQSISDIITNSSSEVFLTSIDMTPHLNGSESYSCKVDEEFLCNNCDRDFLYEYMEIPDILDGVHIDFEHLGSYVGNSYDEYAHTNVKFQDLLDMFRDYVKENQEKFDMVLGKYMTFVGDHDSKHYEDDYYEARSYAVHSFGRW